MEDTADTSSHSRTTAEWRWQDAGDGESDGERAVQWATPRDADGNQSEGGEDVIVRTPLKLQVPATRDASDPESDSPRNDEQKARHAAWNWASNQSPRDNGDSEAERESSSSGSPSSSLVSSASTLGHSCQLSDTSADGEHASEVESEILPRGGAALDVDMLALWKAPVSASASTNFRSSNSDSSGESELNKSCEYGSVSDLLASDSSASVEGLEPSSAESFASSLSSFSTQSGVRKLSDPRSIENIPSIALALSDAQDAWDDCRGAEDSPYPRCRTYSQDGFVDPINVATPLLMQEERKRGRKRGDVHAARTLFARLHPLFVQQEQEHSQSPIPEPRFVSEDPELFVKFSGLQGILLTHVPRRRDFFLDLGCGTSAICKEMALHGYSHVFGVDVAASKIRRQQEQCAELERFARFFEMDASEMHFPDDFFGCVFTKAVMDMVAANYVYAPAIDDSFGELERILREIARCLQPGGVWIMVSCHSPTQPKHPLKTGFDVDERVSAPWWEWSGISEYIHSEFDSVKSYGVGTPILEHGKRAKPFVVLVFRRKQTKCQRLKRLCRIQQEQKRDEREFDVMRDWIAEKRRWRAEQDVIARETRAMMEEDVASRYRDHIESYTVAARAREAVREAIYREVLERDRAQMAIEDAVAVEARVEWRSLLAFVRSVLLAIGDTSVATALAIQVERSKLIKLDKPMSATRGTSLAPENAQATGSAASNGLDPVQSTRHSRVELTEAAQTARVASVDTTGGSTIVSEHSNAPGSLPDGESYEEKTHIDTTQHEQDTEKKCVRDPLQPGAISSVSTSGSTGDAPRSDRVGSVMSGGEDTSLADQSDTATEVDTEAYIDNLLRSAAEQGDDMLTPDVVGDHFDGVETSEGARIATSSAPATNATPLDDALVHTDNAVMPLDLARVDEEQRVEAGVPDLPTTFLIENPRAELQRLAPSCQVDQLGDDPDARACAGVLESIVSQLVDVEG